MPDSSPSRPSEPSLRASLLRQVGGAVLLVAVVSGVFWGIGTMDRTADGELAGQSADEPSGARDGDDAPRPPDQPEEPTDDGAEPDPDTDDGTEDDTGDVTDDAGDPVVDESTADDDDDEASSDDEADEGDDTDADEPPAAEDPAIDPSTISVQVLDGYQADGGAAANAVAAELREAGYNIIAQNPALRYEVTTVLWTAGHEAEARQVAAEIGATEARQQSGNLSSQVAVHVVVGSDRG